MIKFTKLPLWNLDNYKGECFGSITTLLFLLVFIYPKFPPRLELDKKSISKQSTICFDSEFFFSLRGYPIEAKDPVGPTIY